MPHTLPHNTLCLITPGETTERTAAADADFARLVALAASAARAGLSLVQLREKNLRPRVLFELVARCAQALRGTRTRLLVNDRADIAAAAGADGVQLAAQSIDARDVRRVFGPDFLVGVSTHSIDEARAARDGGADFVLFGPVFDTPSKRAYGPPAGLERLREVASALSPFPVVAVGGITRENAPRVLDAGARGVAAIRLFADEAQHADLVREIGNA
jgi:thiamine-phosphate pyrophosphorylase